MLAAAGCRGKLGVDAFGCWGGSGCERQVAPDLNGAHVDPRLARPPRQAIDQVHFGRAEIAIGYNGGESYSLSALRPAHSLDGYLYTDWTATFISPASRFEVGKSLLLLANDFDGA